MGSDLIGACAVKIHSPGELSLAVRRGGVVRVQRVAVAEPLCNLQLHEAKSAMLKMGAENIFVRGIVRQTDGSFTGRIYGLTPRTGDTQSGIGNGDTIAFDESHVFSYGD
jgi:hypothetical protein